MSENRPIPFAGRVDAALLRRAQRVALGGSLPSWVVYGLTAFALAIGLALLFLGQVLPAAAVFSLGILSGLILAIHEIAVRRPSVARRLAEERFEGSLDEEAVCTRAPGGEGDPVAVRWDELREWRGSRSLLLLYVSKKSYMVLAESFFATTEDWQAARALVARKVSSTQEAERRRLVRTLLIWFTVFLLVAVLWQIFVR